MQEYKASLPPYEGTDDPNHQTKSVKVVYLGGKMMTTTTTLTPTVVREEQQLFQGEAAMSVPKVEVTDNECIRKGCTSFAIRSPGWEDEYCSNECAIRHCKDVFAAFVANQHL